MAGAVHQNAPLVTSVPSAAEQMDTWETLHTGVPRALPAYPEATREVPRRGNYRKVGNFNPRLCTWADRAWIECSCISCSVFL